MPSEQTRRDWIFRLFTLSRIINDDNVNLLDNELKDSFRRFAADSQNLSDINANISFKLAQSVFPMKGKVFGLCFTKHNLLISELVNMLYQHINSCEINVVNEHSLSEQEWSDVFAILYVCFSAFERFLHEIKNERKIYIKDVLSFRLFTYQAISNHDNSNLLRSEIFEDITTFLNAWNNLTNTFILLGSSATYGYVDNTSRGLASVFGWRLTSKELMLSDLILKVTPDSMPSNLGDKFGISATEWKYILEFLGYFLMALERFEAEVQMDKTYFET